MTTKRNKRCKVCQQVIRQITNVPTLCGQCTRRYNAKIKYVPPVDYPLPIDDTTEEELYALVAMDFCDDSAEIMDERIARMTAEIQDEWSDKTRERRAVTKKKGQSKLPAFHSSGRGKFRVYEHISTPRT